MLARHARHIRIGGLIAATLLLGVVLLWQLPIRKEGCDASIPRIGASPHHEGDVFAQGATSPVRRDRLVGTGQQRRAGSVHPASGSADEVPFASRGRAGGTGVQRVEASLSLERCLAVLEFGSEADRLRMRQRLADEATMHLLTQLLQAGGVAEQTAFSVLLGRRAPDAMVAALGHLLTRPEQDGYWVKLARQWGGRADGCQVELLVRLLLQATPQGRMRLVSLLGCLDTEEGLYQLLYAAERHNHAWLRELAMDMVFASGRQAVRALMQDVLVTHPDAHIRALAADELAHIGTGDAVRFLAQAGGRDASLHEPCLAAIETVSSGYAQQTLLGIAQEPGYPDAYRIAALRALGQMPRSDYLASMLRTLALTTPNPILAQESWANHEQVVQIEEPDATRPQQEEVWF